MFLTLSWMEFSKKVYGKVLSSLCKIWIMDIKKTMRKIMMTLQKVMRLFMESELMSMRSVSIIIC